MRRPKPPTFATEAEMCAAFIADIPKEWTVYAETGGWDILLCRAEDGFQIGIQAKLRLNADVLVQALEPRHFRWSVDNEGPDCRALMVPAGAARGLAPVADYIGFTVITMERPLDCPHRRWHEPALPAIRDPHGLRHEDRWHEWCPARRHSLPEYVPDVAAGSSAPLQLTQWKIAAMKIAILLERRGFVTRSDFKALKIDHRRWATPGGWLEPKGDGTWRAGRMPEFRAQHPRVYAEIAADADTWMAALPKSLPLPLSQPERML